MTTKDKVFVFDLDDTLYKEIDFLKSAYQEIGRFFETEYGKIGLWEEMLRYYREGHDAFQEIINTFHIPVDKDVLIKMYREHRPSICLDADTKKLLDTLRQTASCVMALVTDGRFTSQMNKIKALGLDQYIDKDDIFISEEIGHQKPNEYAFRMIAKRYKNCGFVYIGDNPQKDFLAPNHLGWDTVCLLDDGRNIRKQVFELPLEYLPKRRISRITEITGL